MRIRGESVDVFAISPRTLDPSRHVAELERVAALSQGHRFTGVLLFTGSDVFVEPWQAAQAVVAKFPALSPLVAVNPVYAHPFTVAKHVSSLAYVHGRKTFLNLVTGTSLSGLTALGDTLTHDERYARLQEFAVVVKSLCAGQGLTRFDGRHYQLRDAQLQPPIPPELQPGLVVAGQSAAATGLVAAIGATHLRMLSPPGTPQPAGARGAHLGLVVRETDAEARAAAEHHFPNSDRGARAQVQSMVNTDSQWKQALFGAAPGFEAPDGYWLRPFRQLQADCPYFVGSTERAAAQLRALMNGGVRLLVLDLPPTAEDFEHAAQALAAA